MTDTDHSITADVIARTLGTLASRLERLTKPPLAIPNISADSDDAEKRDALRQMLSTLASAKREAALSEEDINRAVCFFATLYGGDDPYRHRYADICELVFDKLERSGSKTDCGVPYPVNCLAENIRIIQEALDDSGYQAQARSVLKLADHIDLEKTRLTHYIEQKKTLLEFNSAIATMRDERDEGERKRNELEREFEERLDKTRMEYIAILGVFAAVVLAFNGSIGFSTSAMGALGTGGGVRAIVLLAALVGFVLVNTVCILLVFIWKMSFNHTKVELGTWPRNCLAAADFVLVAVMAAAALLSHPGFRTLVGL